MTNWLLAACVLVTASAVCDTAVSTEAGSCAAVSKGTIAEEIAFVQLASDVHATVRRNDDGHLAKPDQLLAPMGAMLKVIISEMVKNISGQVVAQKDALCNSIRGEVADPLTVWLRSMLKSFADASENLVLGANAAGLIAAAVIKDSVGNGDMDYVLEQLDEFLGVTFQDTMKRVASFAIQVENLQANFTQTMDEMGLHGLAEQVSALRVNQTADLVLTTLKTLEEASVGFSNEAKNISEKCLATCRENIGKLADVMNTLTTVVELAVRDLVNQLQGRLLPVIGRAPPECQGELPAAILDANQTVTTSIANVRQAIVKFHSGMNKVLAILTEAFQKILSVAGSATKSDAKGTDIKNEEKTSVEKKEKKEEKKRGKKEDEKDEKKKENRGEKTEHKQQAEK